MTRLCVIFSDSTIPLVIGIPVVLILVIVVLVVLGMVLAVRRRTRTRKEDRVKPVKTVNGSFNSLNLNNFENAVGGRG